MSVVDSRGCTRRTLLGAAGLAALPGCVSAPPRLEALQGPGPPPLVREFRGAWVASVANIDWPSAPALPEAEQHAQMQAIVARAGALGLNALVLQVRPACDALYASALEPASEYVSGMQGVAPGYDPLALWIEAAHAQGLELHAWFNPFRARHASARSPLAAKHVAQRQPGWVREYGELLWLDPGESGAVAHTLAVIEDVVRRYDIDGVHLDDYFYPYPVADRPFPDETSFARAATALSRDDWRRANVETFVRELYARVHAIRGSVKVGISPFALPRASRRPAGIEGFDPHARLYADAERWLEEGQLDYCAPQLYWPRAQRAQAFDVLLAHWADTNRRARHLWPGLFTSRVGSPWPAEEIEGQLAHLRANPVQNGGFIHFSMRALMDDRGGLATRLLDDAARRDTALVPATPWLDATAPAAPSVNAAAGALAIQAADLAARWLVVQLRRGGRWNTQVRRAATAPWMLPLRVDNAPPDAVAVTALGAGGVAGASTTLRVIAQD